MGESMKFYPPSFLYNTGVSGKLFLETKLKGQCQGEIMKVYPLFSIVLT